MPTPTPIAWDTPKKRADPIGVVVRWILFLVPCGAVLGYAGLTTLTLILMALWGAIVASSTSPRMRRPPPPQRRR